MAERAIPVVVPHRAYPLLRRLRNAYWFIREMSRRGSADLERTKSKHVGATYGLPPETIKRMKARFRNELSFQGGDK